MILEVFLYHLFEFSDVALLVFFHLFPERRALSAVVGIVSVVIFDAPETFVLLCCLKKEIIYVIIEHNFI